VPCHPRTSILGHQGFLRGTRDIMVGLAEMAQGPRQENVSTGQLRTGSCSKPGRGTHVLRNLLRVNLASDEVNALENTRMQCPRVARLGNLERRDGSRPPASCYRVCSPGIASIGTKPATGIQQ
jgi:hypothetical protein